IVQKGDQFNYDDLLKRFLTADTTQKKAPAKPVQYWVRNISVSDAKIAYTNTKPLTKIEIIRGNLQLPLVAWNDSIYNIRSDFS
ncbi:hypothetical protein ACO1MN_16010, partial [Staphylococcus aureus]